MPRKLYILVPASCFCPAKLDSSGHSGDIRFGGHLDDIIRTTAGSVDRVYKHTVWNSHRQNGEVGKRFMITVISFTGPAFSKCPIPVQGDFVG